MKVAKFGGSSLANGPQVKKVVDIIKSDPTRRYLVVSAPGKNNPNDIKVTDLLIAYAEAVINHIPHVAQQKKVVERYRQIANYFHIPKEKFAKITASIKQLAKIEFPTPEYAMAAFKAAGEDHNAKLITMILNQEGVPAIYVDPRTAGMLVTDVPDDATILPEAYALLAKLKDSQSVLVFPGFFGINQDGQICTFSRGGSDITGAIIAKAMKAELYENFTDVDAIYSANPQMINHPTEIRHITFREMRELAYAGFSVFHEEALIPAIEAGISVVVKNTNHPNRTGTLITEFKEFDANKPIAGIASDHGFCGIYVRKYLMNKEVGFTLKLLQILAKFNISYDHIPSGIDDITIIIRENQLTPNTEKALTKEIIQQIEPDDYQITHGYSMVMIVGEGIQDHIGMMAKATAAIANAGVSIVMLNHGASPVSITFGVREQDEEKAVQGLYDTFIKNYV